MTAPTVTASSALPAGTRLGEFEITGVVGEGGFGIVYSARDSSLDRIVAVKEYLPSAFASRNSAGGVEVRSEAHGSTFAAGLSSFINEARMLAKFSHPGLVEVFRFWEANGTAYMAMRYYRGVTLREMVRTNPEIVTEQWLCETLDPILLALQELHNEKCYHRDIAPDNILVLPNGRSVLMDFGAARRIIGGMTRALTTVLKPGYAPIEQYSDDGSMAQGAWTDVYAIGGLLYHAMSGKVPVQAISRMMNDPLKPVGAVAKGQFSQNLCDVVMKCLAVMPENRYQSIDELRAALGWVTTPVSSTVILARPAPVTAAVGSTPPPAASPSNATSADRSADSASVALAGASVDPLRGMAASTNTTDPLASLLGTAVPATQPKAGVIPKKVVMPSSGSGDARGGAAKPVATNSAATSQDAQKRGGLPLVMVGVAVLAVVASAAYLMINRGGAKQGATTAATPTVSAPTEATKQEEPAKVPVATAPEASPPPTSPQSVPASVAVDSPKVESPSIAVTPPSVAADRKAKDTATDAPQAAAAVTGRVDLRIKPWGYVSVDGAAKVSSPPTMQLKLAPGRHEIEITNPAGAAVTKTVDVIAGKSVTVQHNF
ncbi:MAG TPA: protein kinase [Casimicrobium sp.]|nr:protein kinase [Casimicrobium sp.]